MLLRCALTCFDSALRVIVCLTLLATAENSLFAKDRSVQFDFGSQQGTTKGPWNNVTAPDGEGVLIAGAVDENGVKTSVRLIQVDGWAGYNATGVKDSESLPASVTQDSFYLEKNVDTRARIILDGLNPGMPYTVSVSASRENSKLPSKTQIDVQGFILTLDVANNACKIVRPEQSVYANDHGQIAITVECLPDQTYSYLGYLKLQGDLKDWEEIVLPEDPVDGPPEVSAKAWALADAETGEILAGKHMDVVRPMASMTKVMTAWMILELAAENPDLLKEEVLISENADNTSGSSAGVRAGERILAGDLLYGLLLPSGNDAAVALAEHFGGYFPSTNSEGEQGSSVDPVEDFVAEMNRRAHELGMSSTRYFDPHGNSSNYSSPVDLIKLGAVFMKTPLGPEYVSTRIYHADIKKPDGTVRVATWRNTNQLLERAGYRGIKTGTTGRAGECLLACGEYEGRTFLLVIMGASQGSRFVDARNLFRWGFSRFASNGTDAPDGK